MLAATQRIVVERGVRALTLAEVGQTAGYSRGIVNHAFGTRQALVRRLTEELQDRLALEVVDADPRGIARVQSWAASYLSAFERRHDDARAFLTLWADAITSEPDLRPVFVERDERFRDAIAGEIEHGRADGSIRPEVDPAAAAVVLVGQLRGICLQLLLAADAGDLDAVRATVADWITRTLQC